MENSLLCPKCGSILVESTIIFNKSLTPAWIKKKLPSGAKPFNCESHKNSKGCGRIWAVSQGEVLCQYKLLKGKWVEKAAKEVKDIDLLIEQLASITFRDDIKEGTLTRKDVEVSVRKTVERREEEPELPSQTKQSIARQEAQHKSDLAAARVAIELFIDHLQETRSRVAKAGPGVYYYYGTHEEHLANLDKYIAEEFHSLNSLPTLADIKK